MLVLLLTLFIVVLSPLAAAAGMDDGLILATEEPAEEEMSDEPMFEEGMEPAEIAPAESEAEEDQPWTARFLAPTLLVIGVLVLVGSFAYYGFNVRGRYEVVD